jgi:hypothetical protein
LQPVLMNFMMYGAEAPKDKDRRDQGADLYFIQPTVVEADE